MNGKTVDDSTNRIMETIVSGSLEELNELKAFLFKESIRIDMEKSDLLKLKEKVLEDRERLRNESDEVNKQIVIERKRLKEEELFFDKKMEILKNGFAALEMDRKALLNSKKEFEAKKRAHEERNNCFSSHFSSNASVALFLFNGVNNYMALKKRYRDLLKMFHPDNMGGDHEMVLAINQAYDEIKKNYEGSKII